MPPKKGKRHVLRVVSEILSFEEKSKRTSLGAGLEFLSHVVRRKAVAFLISDFLARDPARGYLAHAVSKAAVEGLVRALAVELAPEVSVNGVAPGTVLVPEGTPPEEAEKLARRVPLKRNGEPEDIAKTVLFLCAGPAFLTGQVIAVDGGKSLT